MVRLDTIVFLSWVVAASRAFAPNLPMETYTVNLDDPPRVRWNNILGKFNATVPIMVKYYHNEFTDLERIYVNRIWANLDGVMGNEIGEEIRGIAAYWDIDVGIILGMNILYEERKLLGHHHLNITPNGTNSSYSHPSDVFGCTSIVAQDPKGNVFHGRNLDWNLPNNMRNASFIVDFMANGSLVYKGIVAIAGQIGIPTGMSKRGFSISINERSLGGSVIEDSIEALLLGGAEVTVFARNVLNSAKSYDEAMQMLSKSYIAAPVYYTVAGSEPDQGAVVTRDRNILNDLWQLNVSSSDPNSWYILETNYDHWKNDVPPDDNRRMYGNKYMRQLGQNVAASMAGLLDVLFTWPLRNPFTLEVVLMNPRGFVLQAFQVFNVNESSPFYLH